MDKIYNYIFHFNVHTELWAAIPRDKYVEYWNKKDDRVNTGILYSKEFQTLIDFLTNKKE